MYDKEKIKDELSCIDVCRELGVRMKGRYSKGRGVQIICPAHDDHNFGSCVCTEKKWTCYACCAGGDVFTLISAINGCDFKESVVTAAELTGHPEDFLEPDHENESVDEKPIIRCPVTPQELEVLGLVTKVRIPIERFAIYSDEIAPKGDSFMYRDSVPEGVSSPVLSEDEISTIDVYGNYEKVSIYDLWEEEPDIFYELLLNKADEKLEKCQKALLVNFPLEFPYMTPEVIYGIQTFIKRDIVKLKLIKEKVHQLKAAICYRG